MCPRRPVKPPQVLIEGVLVVWGTHIDRLSVPILPQLDVRVVCHTPICKENGPLAHLLWILVFDDQHDQIGLMNLQVFVL